MLSFPLPSPTRAAAPRWTAPASFLPGHSRAWKVYYLCFFLMIHSAGASDCSGNYDAQLDYFPDKISDHPEYAVNFNVAYNMNYKVLTNTKCGETYVLTQCGTPEPNRSHFSANAKFFTIPLTSVGVDETPTVTFLELLGLRSNIHAVTEYVASPCVNALLSQNSLQLFECAYGNLTLRTLQSVGASAVLGSCSSDANIIAVSATSDPGALNRAEWVKFLAVLFNKEKLANEVFSGVKTRFLCHSAAVSALDKPVVAWLTYDSYSTPPVYSVNTGAYRANYTNSAGGQLFTYSGLLNTADNLLQALIVGGVDIVIDESYNYDVTTYDMTQTLFKFPNVSAPDAPKFIKNRQVWRWDKLARTSKVGLLFDWFEGAVAEADLVLQDVITILHPSCSTSSTIWFRNLMQGQLAAVAAPACTNVSAPLTLSAVPCPTACVVTSTTSGIPGIPTTTTGIPTTTTDAFKFNSGAHARSLTATAAAFVVAAFAAVCALEA